MTVKTVFLLSIEDVVVVGNTTAMVNRIGVNNISHFLSFRAKSESFRKVSIVIPKYLQIKYSLLK
jgi:hypothetical protein